MKKTQYETALSELRGELALLNYEAITPLERLKQALLLTSDHINAMKKEVLQHGFASSEAEIRFFKFVKPAFYALQLYELDFYVIATNAPAGTTDMLKAYYEQELLYVFRFFRTHAFHYQYFRTGARELDNQFFTRDGKPGDVPVLEQMEPLPGFSTPLDYLFAKFIAYERLEDGLLNKLAALYGTARQAEQISKSAPKIHWTGDSINLVELAYGIWLTNQVNNGQASVSEITRWLEDIFGVHIGDAHRRWQEIAQRKSISPTRYLELMISELAKRLDNERSLQRQKRRSK
jgi:hypothetical protein